MTKLITDQIQKTGGATFNLPSTDGTDLQVLKTDGLGNLNFVSQPALPNFVNNVVPADSVNIIGTVVTTSARQNAYGYEPQWTSSGPWTTYYHSRTCGQDANSTTQGWNMFLGDGYPTGTTQITYSGNYRGDSQRELQFANANRVGWRRSCWYKYNQTGDYCGCTWRVLPIRNTTASSITTTVYFGFSAYNSTYGGAGIGYYTPSSGGANTYYSQASSGTWTQSATYPSDYGNSPTVTNVSVVVPANTTILVMLASGHHYYTTYQFQDFNFYYNLNLTFSAGLVCDMRMLHSLQNARSTSNGYTGSYPYQIYNVCASTYGDR
jgi:hypothetical protein